MFAMFVIHDNHERDYSVGTEQFLSNFANMSLYLDI